MNQRGFFFVFSLQEEGVKSEMFVYIILIIFLLIFGGCDININKNITIADGTSSSGAATVNGNIKIGSECIITGSCKTVNGNITVRQKTKLSSLHTVNGYISLEREVEASGDIETINGYITCHEGARVEGTLSTINGNISCSSTEVSRDLKTWNGNIDLKNNSTIKGNVIIEGSASDHLNKTLYVRLSEHSVIKGDILVKDKDRLVKVILTNQSRVEGKIVNAELVKN